MKRSIQTRAAAGQDRNGAATSPPSTGRSRQGSLATPTGTVEAPGNGEAPRVYSYTRFSSPAQAEGDSERRQLELAETYAKQVGLQLDTDLQMVDRGVSGRGEHMKKGYFGAFLDKVVANQVPRGSILLVENLDRLSREPPLTALATISSLVEHGITIQTLLPPETYTKTSINEHKVGELVGEIRRAYRESKRKSDLSQTNWKKKRHLLGELVKANGRLSGKDLLTGRMPVWFDVTVIKTNSRVVDRKVVLNKKAAETIKQIFQWKLEGHGKHAIERKLNSTASWSPPKNKKRKTSGWRASYVQKILRSRAVIGEFQPHTYNEQGKRVPDGRAIPNYFEKVVDAATFGKVQRIMERNRRSGGNGGGKTGKSANLFQQLVWCGYCGGPMHQAAKRYRTRLECYDGRRGVKQDGKPKCHAHSVEYFELQRAVLDNLSKLQPETVLPNPNEAAKQANLLRDAIAGLDAEIAKAGVEAMDYTRAAGRASSEELQHEYEKLVGAAKAKHLLLEGDRAQKQAALQDLVRSRESFEKWQRDLAGLKQSVAKDVEVRSRLRAHLKELICRIEVFAKGHEDEVEAARKQIEGTMPDLVRDKAFAPFMRYVRKRLLSNEGRCYRVFVNARPGHHHASNSGLRYAPLRLEIALAPESSLAGSERLCAAEKGKSEWKSIGPKLDTLLKAFFDDRLPGFVPRANVLAGQRDAKS